MAEGVVVSIHLASGATEPRRGVAEASAVPGRGLEGNRFTEGRGTFFGRPDNELTLVEAEAVEALAAELGSHGALRLPSEARIVAFSGPPG